MTTIHISRKMAAAVFVLLVALDITMRLTAHAPNFTPVAASALFASFLFESSMLAAAVPMVAMAAGDLVIGTYDWRIMVVVYSALAIPVFFGRYIRGHFGAARIVTSALAGSTIFFLTTNFAVWYWEYTRNLSSLLRCYVVAIPFFRNTIAGDLFWSVVLFTSYAVVKTVGKISIAGLSHMRARRNAAGLRSLDSNTGSPAFRTLS